MTVIFTRWFFNNCYASLSACPTEWRTVVVMVNDKGMTTLIKEVLLAIRGRGIRDHDPRNGHVFRGPEGGGKRAKCPSPALLTVLLLVMVPHLVAQVCTSRTSGSKCHYPAFQAVSQWVRRFFIFLFDRCGVLLDFPSTWYRC